MWMRSAIGCMHWMNQCKGNLRRSTEGTWSCKSGTRRKKSNGTSSCSPWSRGWWLCISTSSKCEIASRRKVHNLHHVRLHLHLHRLCILHMTACLTVLRTFRYWWWSVFVVFRVFYVFRTIQWQFYLISFVINSFYFILQFIYFIIFLIIWIYK